MSERIQRLSRRKFLLAAGAGGTAAVAAIAARKAPPVAVAPTPGEHAGRGYQASAHVDNYYRTTRV